MKFPYIQWWPNKPYEPIIPIEFSLADKRTRGYGLVDSGASHSIFDAQLADDLGIADLEAGTKMKFQGVSNHALVGYSHNVTFIVGGVHIPNVPVAFSRDMPDAEYGILGQAGFFDQFPIKFTYRKRQVELMTASQESRVAP